jgi:hypothetical protein
LSLAELRDSISPLRSLSGTKGALLVEKKSLGVRLSKHVTPIYPAPYVESSTLFPNSFVSAFTHIAVQEKRQIFFRLAQQQLRGRAL